MRRARLVAEDVAPAAGYKAFAAPDFATPTWAPDPFAPCMLEARGRDQKTPRRQNREEGEQTSLRPHGAPGDQGVSRGFEIKNMTFIQVSASCGSD